MANEKTIAKKQAQVDELAKVLKDSYRRNKIKS